MAITYKSQGAGVATEASGGNLNPACPATVDANDILIAHVMWEGTVTTPDTPSGWTKLFGPALLGTISGQAWVYGKIADGSEDGATVSFGTQAVTTTRTARIYSFSGYSSGTISQIVRGFTKRSLVADGSYGSPGAATTAAGNLAIALFSANITTVFNAPAGSVGGTWTEAVAEYTQTATTPDTTLGIMQCTPTTDPGAVTAGISALSAAADSSSIGFEIANAPLTSVAFAGSASSGAGNGANIVMTLPSSLAQNDLVIAAFEGGLVGDYDMSSAVANPGWTLITELWADDTQDANLLVVAKFMGETPDATITFIGTLNASEANSAVAMGFRGVDTTRPLDVVPTTATGTNSPAPDPPSITPSGTAGVAVVAVGGSGNVLGGATATGPAGYTTNFVTRGQNDTWDTTIGMGYKLNVTSAENPGVFTVGTDLSAAWAACTIALRPINNTDIYLVDRPLSGNSINGGDITLTLPTTIAENDVVVVAGSVPRLANIDVAMTTSGYTEVADLYLDETNDTNLGVFIKKMGATPDTTAVFTGGSDASDGCSAVALVFRGVDTATPQDVAATTATGTDSPDPDPPSINQADANAVIVVAGAVGHADTIANAFTLPKNYFGITAAGQDTRDSAVGIGFAPAHIVSDPEDPGKFEAAGTVAGSSPVNSTVVGWCAVTMALRKQAAAAGGSSFISILVGI